MRRPPRLRRSQRRSAGRRAALIDRSEAHFDLPGFGLWAIEHTATGDPRGRPPWQNPPLESGDLLVFGGPSRMVRHGITEPLPGTGPSVIGLLAFCRAKADNALKYPKHRTPPITNL
ncbi:hypothetical protein Arub01_20220 [Actinomadura rubrobrunea]|uniref:Alpha-ketoglutarate-dependent dioxygenase AlkB-like domain-containing protein n=1 Tax=Actinomadura rubrobrunea TaxID=115335 RepID=A0A9W6PVI2_9ACTN|nr:hypothetical protein Arub01_20220 [Actinomadura rubrobrunea]